MSEPAANNEGWNLEANIAANRESYVFGGDNGIPSEEANLSMVSGGDVYDLPAIPDGHYTSSLEEVKTLGTAYSSKKGKALGIVGAATATVLVTAATLISYINEGAPSVKTALLTDNGTSMSYSFRAYFSLDSTMKVSLSGQGYPETHAYTLKISEALSDSDGDYFEAVGVFDGLDASKDYSFSVTANAGFGDTTAYTASLTRGE